MDKTVLNNPRTAMLSPDTKPRHEDKTPKKTVLQDYKLQNTTSMRLGRKSSYIQLGTNKASVNNLISSLNKGLAVGVSKMDGISIIKSGLGSNINQNQKKFWNFMEKFKNSSKITSKVKPTSIIDRLKKFAPSSNPILKTSKLRLNQNYFENKVLKSNLKTVKEPESSRIAKNTLNFFVVFDWEKLLHSFLSAVQQNEDIYNIFKLYIEFIQDYDFELFLAHIESNELRSQINQALIIERICLMSFFYFCINNIFEKELLFIKKITELIYLNTCIYISMYVDYLQQTNDPLLESLEFNEVLDNHLQRRFEDLKIGNLTRIEENNKLLWKYITVEVKLLEPHILDSIVKLKLFIHSISLNEAMSYLIGLFSEVVR